MKIMRKLVKMENNSVQYYSNPGQWMDTPLSIVIMTGRSSLHMLRLCTNFYTWDNGIKTVGRECLIDSYHKCFDDNPLNQTWTGLWPAALVWFLDFDFVCACIYIIVVIAYYGVSHGYDLQRYIYDELSSTLNELEKRSFIDAKDMDTLRTFVDNPATTQFYEVSVLSLLKISIKSYVCSYIYIGWLLNTIIYLLLSIVFCFLLK